MKCKSVLFGMLTAIMGLTSCDNHDDHEFIDTTIHIGDVVCSDGSVIRHDDFLSREKTACAVVFYVNHGDNKAQGQAYAVCLDDITSVAFSDSIGVKQNTSMSTENFDGNSNTYTLYNNMRVVSPMAHRVNEYLCYGQSAYIPSLAQMDLLRAMKYIINPILKDCGGMELPDTPNSWYWCSTEVEGQSENKAWLYSMSSGLRLETSKLQEHRVRPIITIW